MTQQIMPPHQAGKVMGIQAGGFYLPRDGGGACIFWNIGGLGALAVASHEGMHQFFDSQLDDQLPMWVEEGLCAVAEGYYINQAGVVFTPDQNRGRWSQLRRVVLGNDWVAIQDLLAMDAGQAIGPRPGQALAYYAQLWALMQMIRSDPALAEGLSQLLADAQAGRLDQTLDLPPGLLARLPRKSRAYNQRVGPAAFARYISDDLDAFQKRYRRFAADLVDLPGQ
jgi:hypothetical protein